MGTRRAGKQGKRSARVEATPVTQKTCNRCGNTYLVTCTNCASVSRELGAMAQHAADGTTVPINRTGTEHQ